MLFNIWKLFLTFSYSPTIHLSKYALKKKVISTTVYNSSWLWRNTNVKMCVHMMSPCATGVVVGNMYDLKSASHSVHHLYFVKMYFSRYSSPSLTLPSESWNELFFLFHVLLQSFPVSRKDLACPALERTVSKSADPSLCTPFMAS